MDNTGITGEYLSSEGKRATPSGARADGGRCSPAHRRAGDHDRDDRPSEESRFPTYWHARGYGLFAANPLGPKAFTEGRETMNFTLEPGQAATFRYRIVVLEEKSGPSRNRARIRLVRRGPLSPR
jgi:hypothetical protein